MIMGVGLLLTACFINGMVLKGILALGSIILNIMAIIKNFKEKKENKL